MQAGITQGMFGPTALTHFVYVSIVIVFVCVISYAVYYNLRMKSRDKSLGIPQDSTDSPSKIRLEKQADERARGK